MSTATTHEPPKTDPIQDKLKALTPEQLEHDRELFVSRFGFGKDPDEGKEKETPPPKTQDEKSDAEKTEDASAAKAKEEADRKVAEEKAAAEKKQKDDENARIKAAAEEASKRTAEKIQAIKAEAPEPEPSPDPAPAEVPPAKPSIELRPKDQDTLAAMRLLEQSDPSVKGLSDRTVKFWELEAAKQKQWETEHPGQKFNPADEEHESWYEENEPTYDGDALEQAKDKVREERIVDRVRRETLAATDKVTKEIDFQKKLESESGDIVNTAFTASMEMIKLASKDVYDQIPEKDGRKMLTPEFIKEAEEKDPVSVGIIKEESEKLEYMTIELEKLRRYPEHYGIKKGLSVVLTETGEKFYPHREILSFAEKLETELAELPTEETQKVAEIDGKKITRNFMRQDEFFSRMEAIRKSDLPENRKQAALRDFNNRHWILNGGALKRALVNDRADKIQRSLARITGFVEKKYGKKDASATASAQNGRSAEATTETVRATRPKPPTSASTSDTVTAGKTGSNSKANDDAIIDQKMGWA